MPSAWNIGFSTVGSTLLTIGITLPIALFYQLRSNAEAFKVLDTCNQSGIASIFLSRKIDSTDLRRAIDAAVVSSNEILLVGIAFRSFFNPSSEYTDQVRERLCNPRISIKVLLLDPESAAAERRASVELGNSTIDDIKHTLNNSLVASMQERIKQLIKKDEEFAVRFNNYRSNANDDPQLLTDLIKQVNIEVRTYDTEPVVFLMQFDGCIFSEQYHLGRPDEIVPFGSCIGKYLPVIQYKRGCYGYRFLGSHFLKIWNDSTDHTERLIQLAVDTFPMGQT